MPHKCKALLIHCMDFRLGEAIQNWLSENKLMNDCDIVSLAGATKCLVTPENEAEASALLHQLEISNKLHCISQVFLMHHTDCGAYGGRESFESADEEYEKHVNDMKKSKELIKSNFSNLEVSLILAKINPLGQISFENVTE